MITRRSTSSTLTTVTKDDTDEKSDVVQSDVTSVTDYQKTGYPWVFNIKNLSFFPAMHVGGLIGLYMLTKAHPLTWLWTLLYFLFSMISITAGCHRLWSHRSYKAKLPLRIFLMLGQSATLQNPILNWVVDHRVHHKCTDTDADPHNAKRGFFFSHIGWLLIKKLPEYFEKAKTIDVSDLWADPVVAIQKRYYHISCIAMGLVVPTIVPWYFWGESWIVAFFTAGVMRCITTHHVTFLVNSAAHMWGYKPYDINIDPAENLPVSFLTTGEGFHNYHHVFPQDYRTSEHGWKLNITTMFIDAMALIGQVADRRQVSDDVIRRRKERTGSQL